ncbi:hypothetical protein BC829DRAFT_130031 [Chytridium lagenaria]|nr:hypothetical protein BC829DRAFT_130031 [Chytridium lagenaria]
MFRTAMRSASTGVRQSVRPHSHPPPPHPQHPSHHQHHLLKIGSTGCRENSGCVWSKWERGSVWSECECWSVVVWEDFFGGFWDECGGWCAGGGRWSGVGCSVVISKGNSAVGIPLRGRCANIFTAWVAEEVWILIAPPPPRRSHGTRAGDFIVTCIFYKILTCVSLFCCVAGLTSGSLELEDKMLRFG